MTVTNSSIDSGIVCNSNEILEMNTITLGTLGNKKSKILASIKKGFI
jgi:hypothetical protein